MSDPNRATDDIVLDYKIPYLLNRISFTYLDYEISIKRLVQEHERLSAAKARAENRSAAQIRALRVRNQYLEDRLAGERAEVDELGTLLRRSLLRRCGWLSC